MPVVSLFNVRALVPIIIVATLSALIIAWRSDFLHLLRNMDKPMAMFACGYVIVALTASVIAGTLGYSIISIAKLVGILVIASILLPLQSQLMTTDRQWVFLGLFMSVMFTAAWIIIDVQTLGSLSTIFFDIDGRDAATQQRLIYYGYFWYKSASTLLVIFAAILGIYLHKHGRTFFAVAIAATAAIAAYMIGSRTATFGIFAALGFGYAFHLLGKIRVKAVIAMLLLAFLFPLWAPALGYAPQDISAVLSRNYSSAHSIVYRVHIWNFVVEKIHERPLLGWGAGASKRLGTDKVGALSDPNFGHLGEPIPVHPHNGFLQIWLEFGLLGASVAFLLMSRGLIIANRALESPGGRIWGGAAIGLFGCFFAFNFSISSSWWLSSVVACIAIAATFAGKSAQRETT